MILYLHGFRSSPKSHKATVLQAHMASRGLGDRFACPQLPVSPREAVDLAQSLIERAAKPVTLIGSSLGGYYATCLAERNGLRAVLANPSVASWRAAEKFLGEHENLYTGEAFEFNRAHIDELRALDVPAITRPERYWLLVETGDEVLDYRAAVAHYAGARQTVLEGGDHSFTRWGDYIEDILRFAGSPGACVP